MKEKGIDNIPAHSRHLTIDELAVVLNNEEDIPLVIMPNGEIRARSDEELYLLMADEALIKEGKKPVHNKFRVPITFRENLGGEYGIPL